MIFFVWGWCGVMWMLMDMCVEFWVMVLVLVCFVVKEGVMIVENCVVWLLDI